jgi:hypothetical protein
LIWIIYQFVNYIMNYCWSNFHKLRSTKIHCSKTLFLFYVIIKGLHNLLKGLPWAVTECYQIMQEDIFTTIFS